MKYGYTDNYKTVDGQECRQIVAINDIPEISVKEGDAGGYISNNSLLTQDGYCWVDATSILLSGSMVKDNAVVTDSVITSSTIAGTVARSSILNSNVLRHARVDMCTIRSSAIFGFAYTQACAISNSRVHPDVVMRQIDMNGVGTAHGAHYIGGLISDTLDLGFVPMDDDSSISIVCGSTIITAYKAKGKIICTTPDYVNTLDNLVQKKLTNNLRRYKAAIAAIQSYFEE